MTAVSQFACTEAAHSHTELVHAKLPPVLLSCAEMGADGWLADAVNVTGGACSVKASPSAAQHVPPTCELPTRPAAR